MIDLKLYSNRELGAYMTGAFSGVCLSQEMGALMDEAAARLAVPNIEMEAAPSALVKADPYQLVPGAEVWMKGMVVEVDPGTAHPVKVEVDPQDNMSSTDWFSEAYTQG